MTVCKGDLYIDTATSVIYEILEIPQTSYNLFWKTRGWNTNWVSKTYVEELIENGEIEKI